MLGIVAERDSPPVHRDFSRTEIVNSVNSKGSRDMETYADAADLMEQIPQVLGTALGCGKPPTRRAFQLARTPSIAVKNLVRFSKALSRVLDKLSQNPASASEWGGGPILPDYSKTNTAEVVYTDVARDIVKQDDTFSFLRYVGVGQPR